MRYHNNKLKNLIFDKKIMNVHFSITNAYKELKFGILSPHIHSEVIVSQTFNLGLSFHFM